MAIFVCSPESIKNRSDIFYPIPERSCVPDSPVWYSTTPIGVDTMTKMLTRILLVREIQEAHLHAQPIYVWLLVTDLLVQICSIHLHSCVHTYLLVSRPTASFSWYFVCKWLLTRNCNQCILENYSSLHQKFPEFFSKILVNGSHFYISFFNLYHQASFHACIIELPSSIVSYHIW